MFHLLQTPKAKRGSSFSVGDAVAAMEFSRERRSSFSLEIEAIGPLDFDGARREVVLRGAGYA